MYSNMPPNVPPYLSQDEGNYQPLRPSVLTWQKIYCGLMSCLYIVTMIGGSIFLFLATTLSNGQDAAILIFQGIVLLVLGLIFAGVFAASFFIPNRPWAWIYNIVLICLGMSSCCTLPATIPLLIYWLKPETQAYFGRKTSYQPPPQFTPNQYQQNYQGYQFDQEQSYDYNKPQEPKE